MSLTTRNHLGNPIRLAVAALVVAACTLLNPRDSAAQIDRGVAGIIQDDALVGLVWAAESLDPCQYAQYMYLGPDYVYPGSPGIGETIDTILRPAPGAPNFRSARQFFRFARDQLPGGKRVLLPVFELGNCGPNVIEE